MSDKKKLSLKLLIDTNTDKDTKKLSLKLLIDTSANKVLFAEVGKEVVDFLFSLLTIPMVSPAKLLSEGRIKGSIPNLYRSLESLDTSYLEPNLDKTTALNPVLFPSVTSAKDYYTCPNYKNYSSCFKITDCKGIICDNCKNQMTTSVPYAVSKTPKAEEIDSKGFVKDVVSYIVMDDLTVIPTSVISGIALLSKLWKNVSQLHQKEVELGIEKGVALMESSLKSTTVLTDIFLPETPPSMPGCCSPFLLWRAG